MQEGNGDMPETDKNVINVLFGANYEDNNNIADYYLRQVTNSDSLRRIESFRKLIREQTYDNDRKLTKN